MRKEYQRSERVADVNLPVGYLANGYFNPQSNLLENFITFWADEIARKLGQASPDMKKHQLRRFYNHVKSLERKLDLSDYESINNDLKMLIPYATSAANVSPPKIPRLFEEFIRKNLALVKDSKSFHAFLRHFECIVCYSERYLKKN
jgi:CRISPR type III-A-associated protein Csm2